MAELGSLSRAKPGNNIYTVLTAIALVVLLIGVVYVAMRNRELFDAILPLGPVSTAADLLRTIVTA